MFVVMLQDREVMDFCVFSALDRLMKKRKLAES